MGGSGADLRAGRIRLGALVLGPETTRAALVAACPEAQLVVENDPHRSYLGLATRIGGRDFAVKVAFEGEQLRVVTLTRREEPIEGREAELRRRKADNDAWLAHACSITSTPLSPAWGRIESEIDPRAGCAYLLLRYG